MQNKQFSKPFMHAETQNAHAKINNTLKNANLIVMFGGVRRTESYNLI